MNTAAAHNKSTQQQHTGACIVTSLPNTTNRLKPKALQLYQQSRPQLKCNAMPKRKAGEEPDEELPPQKKTRYSLTKLQADGINALQLDFPATMARKYVVKCSVLIQALDLAGFNDLPISTLTAWEPLEPVSIVAMGYFYVRRS